MSGVLLATWIAGVAYAAWAAPDRHPWLHPGELRRAHATRVKERRH